MSERRVGRGRKRYPVPFFLLSVPRPALPLLFSEPVFASVRIAPEPAAADPGSGIEVAENDNACFVDATAGVWRVPAEGGGA